MGADKKPFHELRESELRQLRERLIMFQKEVGVPEHPAETRRHGAELRRKAAAYDRLIKFLDNDEEDPGAPGFLSRRAVRNILKGHDD